MGLVSNECHRNSLIRSQHWFRIWINIGPGNGLCHQAITWANVDPDQGRQMASLGHNELIKSRHLFSAKPLHTKSWLFVNWTLMNKLLWNLSHNAFFYFQQNAFANVICKMSTIFQCVDRLFLPAQHANSYHITSPLCEGNPPVTSNFLSLRASYVEFWCLF